MSEHGDCLKQLNAFKFSDTHASYCSTCCGSYDDLRVYHVDDDDEFRDRQDSGLGSEISSPISDTPKRVKFLLPSSSCSSWTSKEETEHIPEWCGQVFTVKRDRLFIRKPDEAPSGLRRSSKEIDLPSQNCRTPSITISATDARVNFPLLRNQTKRSVGGHEVDLSSYDQLRIIVEIPDERTFEAVHALRLNAHNIVRFLKATPFIPDIRLTFSASNPDHVRVDDFAVFLGPFANLPLAGTSIITSSHALDPTATIFDPISAIKTPSQHREVDQICSLIERAMSSSPAAALLRQQLLIDLKMELLAAVQPKSFCPSGRDETGSDKAAHIPPECFDSIKTSHARRIDCILADFDDLYCLVRQQAYPVWLTRLQAAWKLEKPTEGILSIMKKYLFPKGTIVEDGKGRMCVAAAKKGDLWQTRLEA